MKADISSSEMGKRENSLERGGAIEKLSRGVGKKVEDRSYDDFYPPGLRRRSWGGVKLGEKPVLVRSLLLKTKDRRSQLRRKVGLPHHFGGFSTWLVGSVV